MPRHRFASTLTAGDPRGVASPSDVRARSRASVVDLRADPWSILREPHLAILSLSPRAPASLFPLAYLTALGDSGHGARGPIMPQGRTLIVLGLSGTRRPSFSVPPSSSCTRRSTCFSVAAPKGDIDRPGWCSQKRPARPASRRNCSICHASAKAGLGCLTAPHEITPLRTRSSFHTHRLQTSFSNAARREKGVK